MKTSHLQIRSSINRHFRTAEYFLFCALTVAIAVTSAFAQRPFDPAQGILLRGTVVTMDAAGTILHNGSVLVRNGRIVATWNGQRPPEGISIGDAVQIDLGSRGRIFPGLINLHNHPTFNMLELWPAPSSHVEANLGRPLGTEPYSNRYQWNRMLNNAPPEERRLVDNPQALLNSPIGLNLYPEVGKYSEIKAMLGGETTDEGAPSNPTTDNILIRNVESLNFARNQIDSWVPSIEGLNGTDLSDLLARMQDGQIDAWIVHLAEGVRDNQRRAGDTSRHARSSLR
jgi:5-methylthioadenosine/S-adenosylhomocysteine deaminase